MYINLFEDESNKPVFGADIQVQKLGEELTWRQKNVTSDPELGRHDLYRVVPCALLVSRFFLPKFVSAHKAGLKWPECILKKNLTKSTQPLSYFFYK